MSRRTSESSATFFGRVVRRTDRGGVLFYLADGEGLGTLSHAVGRSVWLPRRRVHIFGDREGRTVLVVPRSMIEERLAEASAPSRYVHRELPREEEDCA